MSKRNKSHKNGLKTSTKEKRKAIKKAKYAAMRESAKGPEVTSGGRGREFTKSKHYCKHPDRTRRRKEAAERRKISNKQTPEERLQVLNERLGVNVGARKERTRLQKKVKESNEQSS